MPLTTRNATLCAMVLAASVSLHGQEAVHTSSMEVTHGRPYVMVMVNGRGPFRFILDTGTGGQAIITSGLAEELDLPEEGEARLNDPTGLGGHIAPLVQVDSLSVGGAEFTDVKAIVHKLPSGDGMSMGMLGFPLFRDYLLTLDYPNGRLTLAKGALEPDGEKNVLPFRMPDGVPIASLVIDRLRIDAQIDSGGAGLSLPEQIASRLKFSSGPELFGNAESLSTRFEIKVGKLTSNVRMGDYTLDLPWVEINSAFPLANFGACPMQYLTITFDQRNLLMRVVGPGKPVKLGITPVPVRMTNTPLAAPADVALVPVG